MRVHQALGQLAWIVRAIGAPLVDAEIEQHSEPLRVGDPIGELPLDRHRLKISRRL